MNKSSWQTYLHEEEESLVIASTDIEDYHVLPFEWRRVVNHFQNIVNSGKYRCGDNDILEKSSMIYFRELIKWANKN